MPLKLAPYRPQQLAFAIGTAILLATGTLLGSSAAVAQVITDAERNADALQPELPQYLRTAAEPATTEPKINEPDAEPTATPAEPALETAPVDAAPSVDEALVEEAIEIAPEPEAQDSDARDVVAEPDPEGMGEVLTEIEPDRPEVIEPTASQPATDLRADKALAPLEPIVPYIFSAPEIDKEAAAAYSEPTTGASIAVEEELEIVVPLEEPAQALSDESAVAVADEPVLISPAPAEKEVVEVAEPATANTSEAPALPAPAEIVEAPVATPAPMATQAPQAAPSAVPAQGLRVYYASGNARLSERENRAVEAFCAKASARPDSVVDVHVSMPNAEAIRLVALRQDELRALFNSKGVGGERLRFRLAPYDVDAPGSPGIPLAPHYAEFRLIEKY